MAPSVYRPNISLDLAPHEAIDPTTAILAVILLMHTAFHCLILWWRRIRRGTKNEKKVDVAAVPPIITQRRAYEERFNTTWYCMVVYKNRGYHTLVHL